MSRMDGKKTHTHTHIAHGDRLSIKNAGDRAQAGDRARSRGTEKMGLLVYLLLCRRVCIIINAHDFMAEHTLIRASGERREERRRTERTGRVHSTATPGYRQYDINRNFLEHFHE